MKAKDSQSANNSASDGHYDMIVVGAGLVGSALVCCLRSLSLKILLLDKAPLIDCAAASTKPSRPLSLTYTSYLLLKQLGLWHDATASAPSLQEVACSIEKVHVSEQGGWFYSEFDHQQYNLDALGKVVPAALLQSRLAAAAAKSANFQQINQLTSLQRVSDDGDDVLAWCVNYENTAGSLQIATANYVIGADGVNSQVRELANIKQKTTSANAQAFTASLKLSLHGKAYERFCPGGVLALLPQGDDKAGMVWVMQNTKAELAKSWTKEQWQQNIMQVMRGHLDSPPVFKKLTASYPLQTTLVEEPLQPGLCLMGNAAHTFYPLAAQGFNLSLRDVATFAEIYAEIFAKRRGENNSAAKDFYFSMDDYNFLKEKYLSARAEDQKNIGRITELLVKLSKSGDIPGAGKLRSLGLLAIDLCSPIKNNLAKQFLGRSSAVPRLMRGLELAQNYTAKN